MQKNLLLAVSILSLSLATAAFAQSGAAGSMSNGSTAPSASSAAPSSSSTARHHARVHHVARAGGVRQAQQELQSQGLYQGKVDGKYGPKTRQAVMKFQQQNNIKANGRLDRATQIALRGGSSSAGMSSGNMRSGNTGRDNMGNAGGSPANATSANPNNNADARSEPSGSSMVPSGAGAPKTNPGAMQPAN